MENEEIVETTTNTENTGTLPAEQTEGEVAKSETQEKMFTQEEVNKISKDRAIRAEQRLKRERQKMKEEYDNKYSKLINVINAGMETTNIDEATEKLADFYRGNGVDIPEIPSTPKYSQRDEEILANAEAREIIDQGYDEVEYEIERLASKEELTSREKLILNKLDQEKKQQEDLKELKSLGVSDSVLKDEEFREFESKLNPSLSMKEKYEMYSKLKPKKEIETIGSMKTNTSKDEKYRDNYTVEEVKKFTKEDFDKDPKLMEYVEKSMLKWK